MSPISRSRAIRRYNLSEDFDNVIQGNMTVTTTETSVKVGSSELSGRKMIGIVNDSSNLVFIDSQSPFDISLGQGFTIQSGEEFVFHVDPKKNQQIFIKSDELTVIIRVYEVK